MPRACVIVLDAVGAGELPDAAEWGDEGSDTLGNVARAVGGLDLPNLEALGLGNVEPLEGCPPQPGAPAVAGRLLERSKGKDTTAGHWELMGVVTAVAFPTYPYGFPDDVIDPFMNRTGRGVLCNKPASGTEVIQEYGEQHQKTGKWIVYTSADSVFQIAAHEETIPLEELYDACRAAREILTGKHAVGRVIARPFARDAGPLRAHPEPARLLARAAAAELPERDPRRRSHDVRRREDLRHLRRLRHRRVVPDEVERRRDQPHDRAARERRRRARVHQPRRDRSAVGPPQRPGQLPPLPAGLRPAAAGHPRRAARRRPPDHHVRPRLRPDDAVDRPLARARAAARLRGRAERGGRIHEDGEFGDVGATVCAWLGAKHPGKGAPAADHRAVSLDDPGGRRAQYATEAGLEARAVGVSGRRQARTRDEVASRRSPRSTGARPRGRLRRGRARGADRVELGVRGRRARPVAPDGRAGARRGRRCAVADVQALPFADARSTRRRCVDALPRAGYRPRRFARSPASSGPGGGSSRSRTAAAPDELWTLAGRGVGAAFFRENGEESLGRHFATVERREVDGGSCFPTSRRRAATSARRRPRGPRSAARRR